MKRGPPSRTQPANTGPGGSKSSSRATTPRKNPAQWSAVRLSRELPLSRTSTHISSITPAFPLPATRCNRSGSGSAFTLAVNSRFTATKLPAAAARSSGILNESQDGPRGELCNTPGLLAEPLCHGSIPSILEYARVRSRPPFMPGA